MKKLPTIKVTEINKPSMESLKNLAEYMVKLTTQ
ncbi:hypothetical protein ABH959_001113 [Bacillus sp. RC51]